MAGYCMFTNMRSHYVNADAGVAMAGIASFRESCSCHGIPCQFPGFMARCTAMWLWMHPPAWQPSPFSENTMPGDARLSKSRPSIELLTRHPILPHKLYMSQA
jgi:hypothetical protein